jgi:hypothetical protein
LNLYGFADGDPVNFSDPFGLCAGWWGLVCRAGAWVLSRAGIRIGAAGAAAAAAGRASQSPAVQTVARDATNVVSQGLRIGQSTHRLIEGLEAAGPALEARIQAVAQWLPQGQQALLTNLEGGVRMLSGGVGERARQVILNPDGSTIIKAFNVAEKAWEVIKVIQPQ